MTSSGSWEEDNKKVNVPPVWEVEELLHSEKLSGDNSYIQVSRLNIVLLGSKRCWHGTSCFHGADDLFPKSLQLHVSMHRACQEWPLACANCTSYRVPIVVPGDGLGRYSLPQNQARGQVIHIYLTYRQLHYRLQIPPVLFIFFNEVMTTEAILGLV